MPPLFLDSVCVFFVCLCCVCFLPGAFRVDGAFVFLIDEEIQKTAKPVLLSIALHLVTMSALQWHSCLSPQFLFVFLYLQFLSGCRPWLRSVKYVCLGRSSFLSSRWLFSLLNVHKFAS
eukprot:Opistho-2@39799